MGDRDRVIYHFPKSFLNRPRLERVDVTDATRHVQSPYVLVNVRADAMQLTIANLNLNDLRTLHAALDRELQRHPE